LKCVEIGLFGKEEQLGRHHYYLKHPNVEEETLQYN